MDLSEAKKILNKSGYFLTESYLPVFKKKQELVDWCELHNPSHDAVWVADIMNAYARMGKYKMYDWVQSWAIKNNIDYDNAYINAMGGY